MWAEVLAFWFRIGLGGIGLLAAGYGVFLLWFAVVLPLADKLAQRDVDGWD